MSETNNDLNGQEIRPTLVNMEEIRALLVNPDSEIRMRAIKDLVSLQDINTISLLEEAAQRETDVQNKYQLRKSINSLKNIAAMRDGTGGVGTEFSQNLQKVESALRSGNEEQVNKAFRYILQYRLKQFLPDMENICNENGSSYQKSMLISFLLTLGGELYFSKIVPFLNDKNPRVISNAIEALERIGNTRALAYITQFTTHEHHRVQAAAMKALYNLGDQNALTLFEKMVHSPHEAYRASAAYALKELKIPRSINLLKILAEDKVESVREKAREALLLLDIEKLPETARGHKGDSFSTDRFSMLPPEEKILQIKSMLETRNNDTAGLLCRYLENENTPKVIATLIMGIAICGDSSKAETLRQFLKSSEDRIRANTVEALGLLLSKEEREILIPCLEDMNNRVVGNAILALHEHFSDLAGKALKNLSESSNRNEQLTAVFCIGAIGEDRFLSYSDCLSESSWTEVREKMLSVLEDLSQDSASALRYLKQNRLKMALFHGNEPAEKGHQTTEKTTTEKQDAEKTSPIADKSRLEKTKKTESPVITAEKTADNNEIKEKKNASPEERPLPPPGIEQIKTIIPDVKKHPPSQSSPGHEKNTRTNYPIWLQPIADFTDEKLSILFPDIDSGYEKISLCLFGFCVLFACGTLGLHLFITDTYLFHSWLIKPLQMIFISELFFAGFFYLLFPFIFALFIYFNIETLRKKRLLTGFLTGLAIFLYIPLLQVLNLEYGQILNFFGSHTARFFFDGHSGFSKLALILLNFPWLLLPMLIEAIINMRGFARIIPGFLILLTIFAAIAALQLNQYSAAQLNNRKWQDIRSYYLLQKQQFEGLLNGANNEEIALRSRLGRAPEEQKNELETTLFQIREKQEKILRELREIQGQIKYAESQIEF